MARSQCCSRPLPISRKKICSRQSQKVDLAFVSGALIGLIQVHGPWIIAVVVALENAGVPLPGETILVAAALLAATTNQIDIAVVVAAAAIGAIIGDGIGYTVGRGGSWLLSLSLKMNSWSGTSSRSNWRKRAMT